MKIDQYTPVFRGFIVGDGDVNAFVVSNGKRIRIEIEVEVGNTSAYEVGRTPMVSLPKELLKKAYKIYGAKD